VRENTPLVHLYCYCHQYCHQQIHGDGGKGSKGGKGTTAPTAPAVQSQFLTLQFCGLKTEMPNGLLEPCAS